MPKIISTLSKIWLKVSNLEYSLLLKVEDITKLSFN